MMSQNAMNGQTQRSWHRLPPSAFIPFEQTTHSLLSNFALNLHNSQRFHFALVLFLTWVQLRLIMHCSWSWLQLSVHFNTTNIWYWVFNSKEQQHQCERVRESSGRLGLVKRLRPPFWSFARCLWLQTTGGQWHWRTPALTPSVQLCLSMLAITWQHYSHCNPRGNRQDCKCAYTVQAFTAHLGPSCVTFGSSSFCCCLLFLIRWRETFLFFVHVIRWLYV